MAEPFRNPTKRDTWKALPTTVNPALCLAFSIHILNTDVITALAFHPTRPVIASCSENFSVKVWNCETGQLLDTILGPTRRLGALSFSASGRLLACNSADNVTRVWKLDAAGLISAADVR